MGLFQHPHLIRGVVHTPEGAFTVNRGIVDLPDEVGTSLGWEPVTFEGGWNGSAEGRTRTADTRTPLAHLPAPR